MSSIDDRIVNMKFNNAQFQQGIAETNASLDTLSKSLKLNGATSGIDGVQKAANRFSLENMRSALENISSKFNIFGAVGFTIIQNLTNTVVDAGKRMASALIDPIVQGGAKRALALQQANFQFRGLGLDIEATMAAALAAVKGTAFGLDEAATAAAVLGTSGVIAGKGLQEALRGIAGVAAQSGGSYSEIADIFSNISGQTRVMGTDLLRLSSRGINAAAILAKSMGLTEESVRKMVSEGKISFEQFSNSMNDTFGANAAKANETYTGSLSNMRAALARIGAEVASPYFFAMRDIFNALAPAFDNIKTALQPVLAQFGTLFGLFSGDAVKSINGLDFTNLLILSHGVADAMSNVFGWLKQIGNLVKLAFGDIFPPATALQFFQISKFLRDFTAALTPTGKAAREIRQTLAGVFAVFSILGQIIGSVVKTFFDLIGVAAPAGGSFLEITAKVGGFLVKVDEMLKKGEFIQTFFQTIGSILSVPIKILQAFFGVIADGITNFNLFDTSGQSFKNFADDVASRFTGLIVVGQFFTETWENIRKVAKMVWNFLQPIFTEIGNFIGEAVNNVRNKLKKLKFDDVIKIINTGIFGVGTGGLLYLFQSFFGNIQGVMRGDGLAFVTQFKIIFGQLRTNLAALEMNTNAKTLTQIALAVALLAASAVVLSLVDPAKLGLAMGAIVTAMGALMGSLAVMTKITGKDGFGSIKLLAAAATMQILAGALLLLSASIAILGALPLEKLIQGTVAIIVVMYALVGALSILNLLGPKAVIGAAAIAILVPPLVLLTAAIAILGALPLDSLIRGVSGFVVVLGALVGALSLLNLLGPRVIIGAAAIVAIALPLAVLTGAIAALGALPFINLLQGMGAFVIMLAAITGAVLLLGSTGPMALLGAVAITAVALSVVPLIGAIALLGMIPVDNLIAGVAAFAIALAVLVGAVLLLGFTGPVALIGAAAIVALALGIAVLAPALALLSLISWDAIGRVLTILSAGLGILAVMGILMIPASVGFLLLGGAILLIGSGVFLAAQGIGLLAIGIAALVAIGAGAFALLGAAISVLISKLPELGIGIGLAIVSMVVAIGANAQQLITAFVELLLAMLSAIDQAVPAIIVTATNIIVALVTALVILIPLLVDAGLQILAGILTGIASNIGEITTQAINIMVNFINALASKLPDIITAGGNLVLSFITGIGDYVRNNSGKFVTAGSQLFRAIIDGVSAAIERGGSDLRYAGSKIGNALLKGAQNALGINSPSKKFRDEVMPSVFEGIEDGNDKNLNRAANAGADIGNAVGDTAMTTMQKSLSQLSNVLDLSDIDSSPTIRPVLDLSDIQSKAGQVQGMLQTPTLSLDTSNNVARSVSLQEQARNAQVVLDMSKDDGSSRGDITYIQNNNSPKALSTVELYRQTKNQLSTLKGELGVVDQSGSP